MLLTAVLFHSKSTILWIISSISADINYALKQLPSAPFIIHIPQTLLPIYYFDLSLCWTFSLNADDP